MSDNVLKDLLKEYETKRLHAEQLADERKDTLYNEYPELAKISSEIANCGLKLSREKLQAQDISKDLHIGINQAYDLLKQKDFPTILIGKRKTVTLASYLLWKMNKKEM